MEPNIESKLNAIEAKLSDIEKTVTKIRRVQKTQASVRAVYWIFIILLGFGAFYFMQPYVDQLKETYSFIGGNGDSQNIDSLIQQFKGEDQ